MPDDRILQRRLQRDLEALGKKHPELKAPDAQERLTRYLQEELAYEEPDHAYQDAAPEEGQAE
jgi:hypothetical protein